MRKDEFATEMNEERRTIVMNGEKMELGDDGEYHVVREEQFGRLSKLHATGACCAVVCVLLAAIAIGAVALTEPKSLSETASKSEYSDELCLDEVSNKDPEILRLKPDEVDPPRNNSDDVPSPYTTKGDLDYSSRDAEALSEAWEKGCYYYDPAPKDPAEDPVNEDTGSLYELTIRCVDTAGRELRPPQIIQVRAGEEFSESAPVVSGYHAEVREITDIMPEKDLEYTIRYHEKPTKPE